nr:hypothetical protein BaRGS_008760 [Batillaria attramentaria]
MLMMMIMMMVMVMVMMVMMMMMMMMSLCLCLGGFRRLRGRIKSLQHRLDVALATAASVNQRAQDTATQLTTSVSVDLSDVSSVNTQQGQMMMDLTDKVAEHKDYVIMRINGSVDYVEAKLYEVKDEIYGVHAAVQDRKCEYGFFDVHIEHGIGDAHVQFKTVFDVTPNVSISMVGFTSHLDQHSYSKHGHHGDYLALDKLVDSHDVDESGFSASVLDVSSGNVQLKTVYCSWMACQNLDRMRYYYAKRHRDYRHRDYRPSRYCYDYRYRHYRHRDYRHRDYRP